MAEEPIRKITARQAEIAVLIGRRWSYQKIGRELKLAASTIRSYVGALALILDGQEASEDDDLERSPKTKVYDWVKRLEFELHRRPTALELVEESVRSRLRASLARHAPNTPERASAKRREA